MDKVDFGASIKVEVIRKPLISSIWEVVIRDATGKEKWREKCRNVVTNQGLANLLDVFFLAGTQIPVADWAVGLIESGTPTASSTYAIPIYVESTYYDGGIRIPYVGVRSSLTISNTASKAVFTMNATKTVTGGILVGGTAAGLHTPGDSAAVGAILYCAILFGSPQSVSDDDTVTVQIDMVSSEVV